MSVNFNVAMLRNLQQPIEDSLETSVAHLSQYVAGSLAPADFEAAEHMHLVHGSLAVIGCQAAARLAASIEEAMSALSKPDRRGWDPGKANAVARSALVLTQGLLQHLRQILSDNEDLPVRLWPAWRALSETMEIPPGSPEELFEPDPDFEDLHFAQLADDYLKDVSEGMVERMEDSMSRLSSARSATETGAALREALKVFDQAYSLRHGRGYQSYWLALRARLSIGLLGEPTTLEDKAEWNVLLKEALLELNKFSKNARRVSPELLMKTLRPMLMRWPSHWVNSHPTLAEADRRLGFGLFWKTVDEVESPGTHQANTRFVANQDDLMAMIGQIKHDWGAFVVGEGIDPRLSLEKSIGLLSARRETFSDAALLPLLDEITLAASSLPQPGHVPDELSVEFASAILLVEDAIERRGRLSALSESQSSLQRRRLRAAHSGTARELQMLPDIRWDTKKQERQLRQATAAIFGEVRKDVLYIEDALAERLRDEHAVLDLRRIRSNASLASAVLRLLGAKEAADITHGLVDLIEQQKSEAIAPLTLGVAGLGAYLSARESGDDEAGHLLEASHRAVLGQPMPTGSLSEAEWRRTQKPIEEHTRSESEEAATVQAPVSPPEVAVLPPAPAEVVHAPVAPAAPVFKADWLMVEGGYTETRRGEEIEEFFLEEMEQVLAEIEIQRSILRSEPSDEEARATLRRQFHTIKGSGRLAKLPGLGEIAYMVESRLDQDIEDRPTYGTQVDRFVARAAQQFEMWFSLLRANESINIDGLSFKSWVETSLAPEETAKLPEVASIPELPPLPPEEEDAAPLPVFPEEEVLTPFPMPLATGSASQWPPGAPVLPSEPEVVEDMAAAGGDFAEQDEPASSVEFNMEDLDEVVPVLTEPELDHLEADAPPSLPPLEFDDSAEVEIEGLGALDRSTYDLLVQDLEVYLPILAQAASTSAASLIDHEPIHRAAHTSGSLATSLGMSNLARLARAFEKYLERQLEASAGSAQIAWTTEGQEASESLWLLLDNLIERQSIAGSLDESLMSSLGIAPVVEIPPPESIDFNEDLEGVFDELPSGDESREEVSDIEWASSNTEPQEVEVVVSETVEEDISVPLEDSVAVEAEARSDWPRHEEPSFAEEARPAPVLVEDTVQEDAQPEEVDAEAALVAEEAIEDLAPVPSPPEVVEEAVTVDEPLVVDADRPAEAEVVTEEASSLVEVEDVAQGAPQEEPLLAAEEEEDDDEVAGESEDDLLWSELFEHLAIVSSSLRRIGPILATLSGRRK